MAHSQFRIEFQPLGEEGLRAHVTGRETVEVTREYWGDILSEVIARRPRWLLLVDELRGPPLEAEDWRTLVERMRGTALEVVRIAHVKPHGLEQTEYCEIFALEAGFESRVFVDESVAAVWARYGSSEFDEPVPIGRSDADG